MFGKNAGEWTGRVEISKEDFLAVSVACMAIYLPSPGYKGRTFKLCFLNRWNFNFCVRSSPLRGNGCMSSEDSFFNFFILSSFAVPAPQWIQRNRQTYYENKWSGWRPESCFSKQNKKAVPEIFCF